MMTRKTAILMAASALCLLQASPASAQLRGSSGPYELQVLVDGRQAPTYFHGGETFVLGRSGERYTIRIVNHSGRRIEAVVSVDGRDVIDGRTGSVQRRGYLVPAWGSVDIEGWRLTRAEVAAFRFSSVADSYAGKTGSTRDVGVIGAAIFTERYLPPPRPLYVPPPPPPCYRCERREHYDELDGAPQAKGRSSAAPSAEAAPSRSSGSGALGERDSRGYGRSRPGLGTEFGEAMGSQVREVEFVRSSSHPSVTLGARYNDRDGLIAMGVNVDGWYGYGPDDTHLRQTATPFPGTERRYAQPPRDWNR